MSDHNEILYQLISEFRGTPPDVPYAPGIDPDMFSDDPDPMFVTLPIAEVGATSRNGRHFDRAAVEAIVEQVNIKKLTGNMGHLKPEDRATRFDLPVLQWVGATLNEQDGRAWAKAYIPPYADNVRTYIRGRKRIGATVATSIYGRSGMDGNRVIKPDLETLDLADPARAGIRAAISVPHITSEMEGDMPENENQRNELAEMLRGERDDARTQLAEMQEQVKEYQPLAEMVTGLAEMLDVEPGDVLNRVQEMQTTISELEEAQLNTGISELIAEQVQLDAARPIIRMMLGSPASVAKAKSKLAELLDEDSTKQMIKSMAVTASGGHIIIGEMGNNDEQHKFEDTPEARQKARSRIGI